MQEKNSVLQKNTCGQKTYVKFSLVLSAKFFLLPLYEVHDVRGHSLSLTPDKFILQALMTIKEQGMALAMLIIISPPS